MKIYDLRSTARAVATFKSNREGTSYYAVREGRGWAVLNEIQFQLFIDKSIEDATVGDHTYEIIRKS